MKWRGKQHPVETAVEWLAPMPLAAASGWAAARLGFSLTEAVALAAAALAAGLTAIKVVGLTKADDSHQFLPAAFEEPELGELLLEAKDEVLILDDPLVEPDEDSRVVRLFRHHPTPGELVERIEGFLGEMGRTAGDSPPTPTERLPVDASAALYAALANVRASLR